LPESLPTVAERVGFEPTEALTSAVFKFSEGDSEGSIGDNTGMTRPSRDRSDPQGLLPTSLPVERRARSVPTTLYRYFDKSGALLYVGITSTRHNRAVQHSKSSRWWRMAKTATLTHYPNRAKAEEAEHQAIVFEHPIYNRQQTLGPRWGSLAVAELNKWLRANPDRFALNGDELAGVLGVPPRPILLRLRALDLPHRQIGRQFLVSIKYAEEIVRELAEEWYRAA
jgi:hypothetical protein